MLSTSVITTAAITGTRTPPKVEGFSVSPKLRKKNAPNTSRSGSENCSMRALYRVAPSTRPIRNAPIAFETPSSSPMPPKATASPKNRIVNSSSSRAPINRDTARPPQRASANIATRNAKEIVNCSTTAQTLVSPPMTTVTIAR